MSFYLSLKLIKVNNWRSLCY